MNVATNCKACGGFEVVKSEVSYKKKDEMINISTHGPFEICERCFNKLLVLLKETE